MINIEKTNKKIRAMRQKKKIKVEDIAFALNVEKTTVYKWETYNLPNLDNLFALSKYLGCAVEDLVAYE